MRPLRFPAPLFPALAACAALALPSAAPAQEAETPDDDAPAIRATDGPTGLSDADIDRLADALVEKLADRLADELAGRLGGEPTGPDADVRKQIAALVEQAEPEGRREAIERFLAGQWPQGEPVAEHAADLAGTLSFLGQQLPEEAGRQAFALAAELAERALEFGDVTDDTKEAFGQVFYNAACVHALEDDPAKALADLDRAFEYGFDNLELLKEDSDLDGLRNLPGFVKRLDDWEQAVREAAIAEAKAALAAGETFPLEFTYTDVKGEEHSLDDYRGQVVIVDFWGTWCPPCRREIPSFVKLQKALGKEGLQILGLNYGDEEEEVAAYAEEHDMNYPTGLGSDETKEMVPEFRGYPTTVFVGRDGKVRMTAVGLHDYAYLEAVVSELLAEPAPAADPKPKSKPKPKEKPKKKAEPESEKTPDSDPADDEA